MRIVRQFAAILIGIVFFTSGLLKLIDPVGSSLIVDSYNSFFHLDFLSFLSKPTGIMLPLVETLIGAALICGIWKKVIRFAAAALLTAFTIITAVLVIFQPQMDCGCFGEAIHLTHLQSFIKNVFLCGLWVLAFIPLKQDNSATHPRKFVSFGITAVVSLMLAVYSNFSLPLMDFTDFRGGIEIQRPAVPGLDDGIEEDEAAATQPLPFFDVNWEYRDSLILAPKVIAISSYAPSELRAGNWKAISSLCSTASVFGFRPLILVSGDPENIGKYIPDQSLLEFIFFADHRLLLSLNRSNGGACYLSDGQLVRKWAVNSLPRSEELSGILKESPAETLIKADSRGQFAFQGIYLGLLALLLIL